MESDEAAIAARAQHLDGWLAAFPAEIAAGFALAAEQHAVLAASPLAPADAP